MITTNACGPHDSFDLELVASLAAAELDNLRLGRSSQLRCVEALAKHLEAAISDPSENRTADIGAAVVFSRALASAPSGQTPPRTVEELAREARVIAGRLTDSGKKGPSDEIEEVRQFCLALADVASTHNRSVRYHGRPRPFDR
jgi:hypothetical protein